MIAVSFTLAVSVDSFDAAAQQTFKVNLAALLDGISASDIQLTVEAGSLVVAVRILAPSAEGADTLGAVTALSSGQPINALSAALGYSIEAVSVPLVVPVAFPTPSPPPPSPPPPISPPPRSSGGDGGGAGDGGARDGGAPAGGNGASPPAGPLGSDVPDSLASGGLPEGSIAVIAGISAGAALLCGCVLLALLLRARRKRRFDASLRHTQVTFFTHSQARQNSMRRAADRDAAAADAAAADAAAASPSIEMKGVNLEDAHGGAAGSSDAGRPCSPPSTASMEAVMASVMESVNGQGRGPDAPPVSYGEVCDDMTSWGEATRIDYV